MNNEIFNIICFLWGAVAILAFILLQFVTAPYGRHIETGWGPEVSNRLGWILMEIPSFAIILFFFVTSNQSLYASVLSILWLIHYLNRTFVFPFRLRTKGKKMPLAIVGSAIFFNFLNAGLNGYFLADMEQYKNINFTEWNFFAGLIIFIIAFVFNQLSDSTLIKLRQPGETGYKIPFGYLFNYVSCPNHLTEFLQWTGFALMAWNLPALTFLVWTAANLFPRAMKHHKWYKNNFDNYPKDRKAIIPWII